MVSHARMVILELCIIRDQWDQISIFQTESQTWIIWVSISRPCLRLELSDFQFWDRDQVQDFNFISVLTKRPRLSPWKWSKLTQKSYFTLCLWWTFDKNNAGAVMGRLATKRTAIAIYGRSEFQNLSHSFVQLGLGLMGFKHHHHHHPPPPPGTFSRLSKVPRFGMQVSLRLSNRHTTYYSPDPTPQT